MKLRLAQPENSAKSPPVRRKNSETRAREYLTPKEVKAVIAAARSTGRYRHRDGLLITMLFRHGLRASEAVGLTWDTIHFENGTVYVTRAKRGTPGTHYLEGEELRQLRRLKRETPSSRFVFCSERGGPLTTRSVHAIVQRAGKVAQLPFDIHPHMLRHAKGFQLASKGTDTRAIQGYLGHRDIKSTVAYTALAPGRFKGLEKD